MTNRSLTALAIRIGAIVLFSALFQHLGAYFLSVYSISVMTDLGEPVNNLSLSILLLGVSNIIISTLLFIKAEWISKKLITSDAEIKTELNAKSLTKIILLSTSVIWLGKLLYSLPNFIEYSFAFLSQLNGNEASELPNFDVAPYILKIIVTLLILFRIERITNWIVKKL